MVRCTHIPPAPAKGGSKRLRKTVQGKAAAEAGEPTPNTPLISTSKKAAEARCCLKDLPQQTPMPQSDPGSEFGPPPPETTPTPHRKPFMNYQISYAVQFDVNLMQVYSALPYLSCLHHVTITDCIIVAISWAKQISFNSRMYIVYLLASYWARGCP